MPAVPPCLLEPIWVEFAALLGGEHPGFDPAHPRGCHPTRQTLPGLGFAGQIAHKGAPAPLQAGRRWLVERTHSWMNGYGKLRRMTDRDATIVEFYLYLAAALVTVRQLIQRARTRYRWDTRPTAKRLK